MSEGAYNLHEYQPITALKESAEWLGGMPRLRLVEGVGSLAASQTYLTDEALYPSTEGQGDEAVGKFEVGFPFQLPPTDLDTQEVKRQLDTHNNSTPDQRIANLLTYAWMAGSVVERSIPNELLPFITDNPGDWWEQNKTRINDLIAASHRTSHPDRYALEDLIEDTEQFEVTPFLRNAQRISKIDWDGHVGMRTEISARLILLEAQQAYQRSFST